MRPKVQKLVLLLLVTLFPLLSFTRESSRADSLKILSWNVYLLPNPPVLFGKQNQRCAEIIPVLEKGDWDVVVLQEVFMKKHSRRIIEGLKESYPYHYGPIGKKGFLNQNSGLLILSRIEATCIDSILFTGDCRGGDCFANKGAIYLEFQKAGHSYQIVGTHMQSGDSPRSQKIRNDQVYQIRKRLMDPNARDNVPQFLVGDLNTDQKAPSFKSMLLSLSAQNAGEGYPVAFTYDSAVNQLAISENKERPCRQVLDYILFRRNRSGIKVRSYKVRTFRKKEKNRLVDLADHFAVESVFLFREAWYSEKANRGQP